MSNEQLTIIIEYDSKKVDEQYLINAIEALIYGIVSVEKAKKLLPERFNEP